MDGKEKGILMPEGIANRPISFNFQNSKVVSSIVQLCNCVFYSLEIGNDPMHFKILEMISAFAYLTQEVPSGA